MVTLNETVHLNNNQILEIRSENTVKNYIVAQSLGFGASQLGCEFWNCHLLDFMTLVKKLPFLCLGFFT